MRRFARRAALDEAAIEAQLGVRLYLTPAMVGAGVIQIRTDPEYPAVRGFHIKGEGLRPLLETDAILTG